MKILMVNAIVLSGHWVSYNTMLHVNPTFRTDKKSRDGVIQQKLTDDDHYAIFDTNNDWLDLNQFHSQFVAPFVVEKKDKNLRIYPVMCIIFPLLVVLNYQAEQNTHYLVCSPKNKWSIFFTNRILHHMGQKKDISPNVEHDDWEDVTKCTGKIEEILMRRMK